MHEKNNSGVPRTYLMLNWIRKAANKDVKEFNFDSCLWEKVCRITSISLIICNRCEQ